MKHKASLLIFTAGIVATIFLVDDFALRLSILSALTVVYVILISFGITTIRYNWFFKSISRAKNNQLCFTFDDGPNKYTSQFLDVLKAHEVKASFFLIGKNCEKNPELVKRIFDEGHLIGNHSYAHENALTWSSTSKVKSDIERANAVIQKITGRKVQAYRPPFGVTNPKIGKAIQQIGMISVGWSIRTYDTNGGSTKSIVDKVKKGVARGGNIILMHDSCENSINALDELIGFYKEKGMEIVAVDQIK